MSKIFKTSKGTELPIGDIKGKPYLNVAYRLVWFREEHPTWTIATEIVEWDKAAKWIIFKAHIIDDDNRMIAEATKAESSAGFADYIEKAETGAIGRALALCGYGTQFTSDELDEGDRLADAPAEQLRRGAYPPFPKE